MHYKYSKKYQQKLEEILDFVKSYNLDPKETLFVPVDQESIFYVAANYFPVALPHWSRGKGVISLRNQHQRGAHIYEVVFNSTPAIAYMSDRSNDAETEQVIAHVFGHTHIYKHNIYEYNDDAILDLVRRALEIYEDKLQYYSPEELDIIVDTVNAFWNLLDYSEDMKNLKEEKESVSLYDQNSKKKFEKFKNIKTPVKTFKDEYLEQVKEQQKKRQGHGEVNVLKYILEHSPIEPWMKELIEIELRMLKDVMKKSHIKIVHEGFASWIDKKYMLEKMHDFNFMHAMIMDSRVSYVDLNNPYWFGYMLLSYAEQEGKDIPEYVKTIDDAELIAENFTEEFLSFLLKTIGEDTAPDNYEEYVEHLEQLKADLIGKTLHYKPRIFIDSYDESSLEQVTYNILRVSDYSINRKLRLTSLDPLEYNYALNTLKILEKVWMGPIVLRYPKVSK